MIELSFKNDFGQIMGYDIFLPPKIYVLPAQLGYTNVTSNGVLAYDFNFFQNIAFEVGVGYTGRKSQIFSTFFPCCPLT